MSVTAMAWVWRNARARKYQTGELCVMLALADYADDDGGNAFPRVDHLALKVNMSTRQVQRLLKSLEARGEIATYGLRGGRNDRKVKVWQLMGMRPDERGDILSQSPDSGEPNERGDILSEPKSGHGVTNPAERGDTSGSRKNAPPTPPYMDEPSGEPLERARANEASPWWEEPGVDALAVEIVECVKSVTDSRGVRCYRNAPIKEADVLRLVAYLKREAPDVEAIRRDVLRPWANEVAKHDGVRYTNSVQRMESWAGREEPNWRKIKRARQVDGEIAARSGSETVEKLAIRAKGGRMVYVWEGRDLSREEAAAWHEDRGMPIPRELEQALLEAS